MEKILLGLMSSDKPIQLKRSLAAQIANAGKKDNLSYNEFTNMLNECLSYLHGSCSSTLNKECQKMVKDVLQTWILNNTVITYKYVEENFLHQTPDDQSNEESKLIYMIFIMESTFNKKQHNQFLEHTDKLQNYFYKTFTSIKNISSFALICKAYLRFPFLLPKDLSLESVQDVIGVFVKVLSETPISEFLTFKMKDTESHQGIFTLLTTLTTKNSQVSKLIGNQVFKSLTKEGIHPSICVAKLLQYLDLNELSVYIDDFIKYKLADDLLVLMTCRLLDWICLPDQTVATEQWALQVLKFLIQNRKFSVLFTVVEGKIKQVSILFFFRFNFSFQFI